MIIDRIDAITRIPQERRAKRLPAPRSVKIELTARCNFACSFCARSLELRDQQDMDKALFRRLAFEMREAGVEELGLFYLGESMMLPWLPEAIEFAKQQAGFPYVFLTTNGSLAKPSRVQACMAAGLDSLKFSLNYSDAEQFAEIARCDPRTFDLIVRNVKEARRVRDEVSRQNAHWCGLYASYIEYDGEQRRLMQNVIDVVTPYVDEIYGLPLYSQADLVTDEERRRGWKATAGNRGRSGALRDPLPCWAVFTEGHVTWDGKLSACCFDHDGRFEMGDLTKQGFMDAWNSRKFEMLREAHLAKEVRGTPCENCVAYA